MAHEYTTAQRLAIENHDTDICVAAGAGSGKTGVLVERFVRLVTGGNSGQRLPSTPCRVDEILVITFTDKATREMKGRIVNELTRMGLTSQRREVETAYISTIHGFCSRLLQENPFEAGCDPQFTVIDEPRGRRLLRQCIETVIARAYAQGNAEIIELVASIQAYRQYGDDAGEPLAALSGAVESVLNRLRGAGVSLEEADRHWKAGKEVTAARALAPVEALLSPIITEITACSDGLHAIRQGMTGAARLACDALLQNADCVRPGQAALGQTLAALEALLKLAGKGRPRNTGMPQEVTLAQLMQRVKIACEAARDLYGMTAAREEQAALACHRLWGLVCAVWRDYEEAKEQRGVLDSDDLQTRAVQLLERSEVVRSRCRKRFKHLMVDEFQDTNAYQMRLIDLLHGAIGETAAVDAPNRLFLVGDVRQSIYAFRHADPELFREIERRFREHRIGRHISLSVNFRSRPEILQAVETIFRQAWRDDPTPFVPLTPGSDFDPKPQPSLELLVTQDLLRRDYLRLEAEALAARLQQLVEGEELRLTAHSHPRHGEPIAYRDIAILLRGLTDIQKYEEAFARRGVPCFVVGGGRGYYARHEIRDLRNALTALDSPLDDIALTATLRSPLVGVDTDTLYALYLHAKRFPEDPVPIEGEANERSLHGRNASNARFPLYPAIPSLLAAGSLPAVEAHKLTRFLSMIEMLRAQEDRLPVGHLIERLIAQTEYDARLLCRPGGRRRLANVRKLLQMANADPVMGVREFIRRLRDLEKLSDREGDAPTEEEASDVVRLMTIHGAKGLEFPVVVLADLSRGLLIPERGLFACDAARMALGTRLGGDPNIVYRAIDRARQDADRQEAARLLYVAMTRAREHLILCGNIGRNRGYTWADNLFPLLGVLDAPPEPEQRILTGGLTARVAALAHYAHAPHADRPGGTTYTRRASEQLADRLAASLLLDHPES